MVFGEGTFDSLSLSSSSLAFHLSIVTANILDCGQTFRLAGGGGTNQIQKQASHVATAAEMDDASFNSFIINITYIFRFSSPAGLKFPRIHGSKPYKTENPKNNLEALAHLSPFRLLFGSKARSTLFFLFFFSSTRRTEANSRWTTHIYPLLCIKPSKKIEKNQKEKKPKKR